MSRLLAAILISAATIATPLTVQAFGLPGIPGMGGKSDNAGSSDLSGTQDELVKQYVSAGKSVSDGNAKMLEAVGLKKEAASARAGGEALTDGATKGSLSDADKASSDANIALAAAMKNPVKLDDAAKAKFSAGILSLAQGLGKYVGMKDPISSFQKGLSSASPMMLPKLQSGSYIVSSLPSSINNLSGALNNAINFAKSHDIAIPSDATAAMTAMK